MYSKLWITSSVNLVLILQFVIILLKFINANEILEFRVKDHTMIHIILNFKSAIHHSKHKSNFKFHRIHLYLDIFNIIIFLIHVYIFLILIFYFEFFFVIFINLSLKKLFICTEIIKENLDIFYDCSRFDVFDYKFIEKTELKNTD